MASLNPNPPFTFWELSPQELLQGSVLPGLTKLVIQNLISSYATERLAREVDPSNVVLTLAADAKSKGQIESLQYLLDLSKSAEEQLVQERNAPESGFGF